MKKLEEFVNEKLKVTKNSGGDTIKTTLRKFLAWFTGEDEYHINRYDLEDRNFISSDESMSKGDITDFLYRHINDTIYVTEEPKESRIDVLIGLRDEKESKSRLYDYSFDIDGKTFSIDARIYNDDELLSNNRQYIIIEKLKVSNKSSNILQLELRNFITWYMYDDDEWDASELKEVEFAENTTNKYFNGSYSRLYDFICNHEQDVIYVSEEYKTAGIYMYSFEVDEIPFEIQASVDKESDLLSNQSNILIEKLKVTTDSIKGSIKSSMKGFFLWYWNYDIMKDEFWDSMEFVEFENDVIEQNFNNTDEFLDWFSKNMDDIVYFDEVKAGRENYRYTFSCDGMEFVIDAWVSPENGGKPFSKSEYIIRRLQEKLRITKNSDVFLKKNKLKDILFKTFNIGSWRMVEFKELFTDARKEYFNDDMSEMLEFFKHNENREVEYNIDVVEWLDDTTKMVELYFTIDGKEFKEQFIEED